MTERASDQWVDVKNFRDKWVAAKSLGGGGQGRAYRVYKEKQPEANHYFLKELKQQDDPERRGRLMREAAALASYDHRRIPKMIESNALYFKDRNYNLYLVTDLIAGSDLAKYKGKGLGFDEAVALTEQLLEVVAYLQDKQAIHRDIKPDNIILRGDKIDLVLVDFGLTFNQDNPDEHETKDWQEVGNRFLRLPELASYSYNKNDLRTDLSFVVGILFFALFGQDPAVLDDGSGKLPHQRAGIDVPSVSPNDLKARRLSMLFDRGFQPRISDRFQTVNELGSSLKFLKGETVELDDTSSIAKLLRERASGALAQRQKLLSLSRSAAWAWLEGILREASALTDGLYVGVSSGEYDPNTDHAYRNMGLHHHFREHLMRHWLKTTCRFVGTELVVTIENENGGDLGEILRTNSEAPIFEFGNKGAMISRLLRGALALPDV